VWSEDLAKTSVGETILNLGVGPNAEIVASLGEKP
jgi:hypothetical protein